jgi:uncharacterized membrane protein
LAFIRCASSRRVSATGRSPLGGEGRWKGIYSVVALVGLVLIVWGYSMARLTAPILYDPPIFMRHINLLLMYFAFVFLVASQCRPDASRPRSSIPCCWR